MKTFTFDITENLEKTFDAVFRRMLEKGGIDALFIPKKAPNGYYLPSLISDPAKVNGANPFAAVMPINSATLISNITRLTASPGKIGVVLKPCEYRALVELVKLKQVTIDNLIILVTDCLGTFPLSEYLQIAGAKTTEETFALLEREEGLRTACRTCEHCIPEGEDFDVAVQLLGIDRKKHLSFEGRTDKGIELLEKSGGKEGATLAGREKALKEFIDGRKNKGAEIIGREREKFVGIDRMTDTLEPCISCHNCMDACPICYCKECFFESPTFEYEAEKYLRWSGRKGSIRMPVGTLLFHLGRMNHMAVSCVGCGMCEQACPAKIPLLSMFKSAGADLQKVFEYLPGRSLKESLPLIIYKENELEPQ